jgi:erythronate-4-phosphate dehydrogenase
MLIVADPLITGCRDLFGGLGELRLVPGRAITRTYLRDAEVLLVRSVTRVDADLLAGSRIRFVGSATAGVDHVDLDYLNAAGIPFAHAPGSNAVAVAEYVVCAVVEHCLQRGLASFAGLAAGIIGRGHTGMEVARLLGALGIECRCNDPPRAAAGDPAPYVDLATALAADIVTLHVPLTDTAPWPTRGLLGGRRIAALRPGTLLINAARGEVLDERALRDRLEAAADLAVVLDCWQHEPAIDPDLLRRVAFGTPHIAGHTIEARWRGTWMLYQAYCRHFATTIDAGYRVTASGKAIQVPGRSAGVVAALSACCRQAYHMAADSARLKAGDGTGLAAHFDSCRQDRLRHEFAHYPATADTIGGDLRRLLCALGFGAADPGTPD